MDASGQPGGDFVHWAIQRHVDEIEQRIWQRQSVNLADIDLNDFVAKLKQARMTEPAAERRRRHSAPTRACALHQRTTGAISSAGRATGKIVAGSALARRLTVLFGGSGVGKTSVLRAAAVPLIEETTGSSTSSTSTPGRAATSSTARAAIAAALPHGAPRRHQSLPELAAAWAAAIAVATARARSRSDGRSPLVLCSTSSRSSSSTRKGRASASRASWPSWSTAATSTRRVVLSLRDDRLALLERLAPRIPDILTNRIELEPLDYRGVRDACTRPLDRYNEPTNPDRGKDRRSRSSPPSSIWCWRPW